MAERIRNRVGAVLAVSTAAFLSACSGSIGQGCNQASVESDPQSYKTSAEFNSFLGGVIVVGRLSPKSGTKFIRVYGKGGCTPGALQIYKPGPEVVDDGQGNVTLNW